MAELNKTARDIMVKYQVHSCTDVTGFGLLGHSCEMARGSQVTIHLHTDQIPYHKEALSMAELGMIPEGAYRNRKFAQDYVRKADSISLAMEDILYDPQTSGGLLISVSEEDATSCLRELEDQIPCAKIIGHVTDLENDVIILD
jgi:selenide,water dikinase